VIALLQARLADAVDLASQMKQAHWNVKGPNFIALHELFDQVATEAAGYSDLLAERIATLGGLAEGTAAVAAERSNLPEYPVTLTDGADHVAAVSTALGTFAALVRADIDEAARIGDAGTADLFTEISRGVDKQLWFVEAHAQAAR
jgi:starvation-inducible DNA-binding protein